MFGPADLYVVEFPTGTAPDPVTATLRDVAAAGVVTLLDAALVRQDGPGQREIIELDDFTDEMGMTGLRPPAPGLIGEDDIAVLTEGLAPGRSALLVLVENTWARRFAQAVGEADASILAVRQFTADVVNEVAHAADERTLQC